MRHVEVGVDVQRESIQATYAKTSEQHGFASAADLQHEFVNEADPPRSLAPGGNLTGRLDILLPPPYPAATNVYLD